MGFPARTTVPTVLRFLRVVVEWVTARASALSAFLGAAHSRLLELLTELPKDGSALRELEEKMHREVGRCLDIVRAAVLRAAHSSPEDLAQVELLRVANPNLRLQDRNEEPLVSFLGGSGHRIPSPYMLSRPPRGPGRPRGRGKRGKPGSGLYPFLAVLGVHDRVTPALVSEVGRQVASCPQEQARSNLARRGIDLGKKTLSRLVSNFGSKALQYREQRILAGKATELGNVGDRRIAIGTDGGRLRCRVPRSRGRKKVNGRRGFDAAQRARRLSRMKKLLDKGDLESMQAEFAKYFKGCNSKVRRKIAAYFERNTERMRYDQFREAKLPLGSGAVESCVRRLVNLRMKGNGIFWKLENAERLLLLRGQLLAGRWDQFVDAVLRPNELRLVS